MGFLFCRNGIVAHRIKGVRSRAILLFRVASDTTGAQSTFVARRLRADWR